MAKQLCLSIGKALSHPSQGLIRCSGVRSTIMLNLERANISRKERKFACSSGVTWMPLCRIYHPISGLEQVERRNRVTMQSRCSFMLEHHLELIDAKASQIKQLADNIFEYSLVSRQQEIKLEPPAPAQQIFHDLLSEYIYQWSRHGLELTFELDWTDIRILSGPWTTSHQI